MHQVAVVKYAQPRESLRRAVEMCGGFTGLTAASKVVLKPNFIIWMEGVEFPKFGVITTARVIADMVELLAEHGVSDITLLEGAVQHEKGGSMVEQAVEGMNLTSLVKRFGLKVQDVHQGGFAKKEVDGLPFAVSEHALAADFLIDLPVLKTHTQSQVSLGMKNLKGLLNIASRKRCHNASFEQGLDHYLARLADLVQPGLTVIDGIFSLERGPLFTGQAHRADLLIASTDVLAADQVGATILGYDPAQVPHLRMAAEKRGRPMDLGDIDLQGGVDIKAALPPHAWQFEHDPEKEMPVFMAKAGIKGIRYPEADDSLCTYCSHFINYIIMGILSATNKDQPFDDIEVLYGKKQEPSGQAKHTLLAGQCQVKANAKDPRIRHAVKIKGCPPSLEDFVAAYAELGILLPEGFTGWMATSPETLHMKRYRKDPAAYDTAMFLLEG